MRLGGSSKRTAKGLAEVLRSTPHLQHNTGNAWNFHKHSVHTDYAVRVQPETGEPFDSTLSAWTKIEDLGDDILGCRIPVLYDPQAPDKCELDDDWYNSVDFVKWLQQETSQAHLRRKYPDGIPSTRTVWTQATAAEAQAVTEARVAPATARTADPQAAAAAASPATTAERRLAAIKALHDTGDLTDDEYAAKRREIIDAI